MPTFGQIAKGTRARNAIKLGLGRARISPETGTWEVEEGGTLVDVDVRPLNPIEVNEVASKARAFAIAKGIPNPVDGEELYDNAKILHTLAMACIDHDSPLDRPTPFFDGGFDQIHESELLLPDHLGYLYEQQQNWQDACSPRYCGQSPGQFMAAVVQTAAGDQSFFVGARPGMRWDFTRTLAAAYLNLMTPKSPSTSDSSSTQS